MVNNINSVKAAGASIGAALFGEFHGVFMMIPLESVNTALQHAAWVVAILAGFVSIVNGCRKWFKREKPNINEEDDDICTKD